MLWNLLDVCIIMMKKWNLNCRLFMMVIINVFIGMIIFDLKFLKGFFMYYSVNLFMRVSIIILVFFNIINILLDNIFFFVFCLLFESFKL